MNHKRGLGEAALPSSLSRKSFFVYGAASIVLSEEESAMKSERMKKLIAFPEEEDVWLVKKRPSSKRAIEYEMRAAAALLRRDHRRVTYANLATFLQMSESGIRKRLERQPELARLIGLVPGQRRDPRRHERKARF